MNKRKRKLTIISVISFVVIAALTVTYIFILNPLLKYNKAARLLENGQYDEAVKIFTQLGDYGDSIERIHEIALDHKEYLEEGMIIPFGEYVGEEIEWYVASVEDDRVLLLSRYALEQRRFDDDSYRWSTSEIRQWLNGEFYETSFSEDEKEQIYEGDGNVFLLSAAEFADLPSELRCCTDRSGVSRIWWLKAPGNYHSSAAIVYNDGRVSELGNNVDNDTIGVRPAIWISIE